MSSENGEHDVLWRRWFATRDPADRDALAQAHMRYVRILAAHCYAQRIGHGLEFADYFQFGMVGLLEAIDRYRPDAGAKFETFAGHRVRGAILNGIENLSEVQKQVSVRRRAMRERSASIAEGTAREADALDRLAAVAIGLAVGFALEGSCIYVEEDAPAPDSAYTRVEMRQLASRLAELVRLLPAQERTVIQRHYYQQVPFDEIARQLSLSKGRVSQVHRAALERLNALHARNARFAAVA